MGTIDKELAAEERARGALALVERAAAELCRHPAELVMRADVGGVHVAVDFAVANESDSRQLVGPECGHLRALERLAQMMFRGTGKRVSLGRVAAARPGRDKKERWKRAGDGDWPRERLLGLLRDLAAACFPGEEPELDEGKSGEHETTVVVRFPGGVDEARRRFGLDAATLLRFAGTKAGRRLNVDVSGPKVKGQ